MSETEEPIADVIARLRARIAKLESALIWIAVTFTEDSHGDVKTLPAREYQAHAHAALAGEKETT